MNRIVLACLLAACTTTYDYDPAVLGDPEADRAPRAKTSSQFVRGMYADLLGRTPEVFDVTIRSPGETLVFPVDEQGQLIGALDGLGDSLPVRNLLVNGLLHSTELNLPTRSSVSDPRAYIRDQFTRLLGREPNAYELQGFADAWQRDAAVGPRAVIRAIVGSREYQSQ